MQRTQPSRPSLQDASQLGSGCCASVLGGIGKVGQKVAQLPNVGDEASLNRHSFQTSELLRDASPLPVMICRSYHPCEAKL